MCRAGRTPHFFIQTDSLKLSVQSGSGKAETCLDKAHHVSFSQDQGQR